jgi:DNA-binding response OmpR family regulator
MTGSCRVLVLEDEVFIADEIALVLAAAGYIVVGPVATVADALRLLADAPVDGAVIDANIRGESSAPVAEALRHESIPFVVCSGYRLDDLQPTFGSVTLLAKPIRFDRLVAILKSCIVVPPG